MLVMLSLIVFFFGTILVIVYLRSRENMSLIERGINPRTPKQNLPRPFVYLKYGLLLAGAGLGLISAFLIDKNMHHMSRTINNTVYYEDFPEIYFAMILLGGGLGLVISYLIERKHWLQHQK